MKCFESQILHPSPKKWGPVTSSQKKKKKIRFQRNRVYYFTCLFSLFWYIYVNDFPFLPFSPFWYFLPTYPFPWISSYLWSTYNIFIFVSNETFFQQSFVVVVLWGWSGFREEERRDCCHFLQSSFFFMSLKFLLYLKQSLECFYDYPGLQF